MIQIKEGALADIDDDCLLQFTVDVSNEVRELFGVSELFIRALLTLLPEVDGVKVLHVTDDSPYDIWFNKDNKELYVKGDIYPLQG